MENEFEKEMPIGFALSIALNEPAMSFYSGLDQSTKYNIKNYIQNASTGDDAKNRIYNAVDSLANNTTSFLNTNNLYEK